MTRQADNKKETIITDRVTMPCRDYPHKNFYLLVLLNAVLLYIFCYNLYFIVIYF